MQKEAITNNTGSNSDKITEQANKLVKSRHSDYTAEYRNSILEVWDSGIYATVVECAKNYDIKENTLYNWISQAKKPIETVRSPEYVALKKDNIRLKMELEILKKAAIYFASHAK
jgi:transposase-like protein